MVRCTVDLVEIRPVVSEVLFIYLFIFLHTGTDLKQCVHNYLQTRNNLIERHVQSSLSLVGRKLLKVPKIPRQVTFRSSWTMVYQQIKKMTSQFDNLNFQAILGKDKINCFSYLCSAYLGTQVHINAASSNLQQGSVYKPISKCLGRTYQFMRILSRLQVMPIVYLSMHPIM